MSRFLSQVHRHGTIIGFTGLMGSGKTGCMTLVAAYQREARAVRANYTLIGWGERMRYLEDLECYNSTILLDEFQLTMNSRSSMSHINKDLSAWAELKIRKRNNILLYTVQDFDMVDVNIRRLTAYLYDCEYRRKGGDDFCKVIVYANARYGRFSKIGSFFLRHSSFYGLYDTKDEDVILLPRDGEPVKSRKKASSV